MGPRSRGRCERYLWCSHKIERCSTSKPRSSISPLLEGRPSTKGRLLKLAISKNFEARATTCSSFSCVVHWWWWGECLDGLAPHRRGVAAQPLRNIDRAWHWVRWLRLWSARCGVKGAGAYESSFVFFALLLPAPLLLDRELLGYSTKLSRSI